MNTTLFPAKGLQVTKLTWSIPRKLTSGARSSQPIQAFHISAGSKNWKCTGNGLYCMLQPFPPFKLNFDLKIERSFLCIHVINCENVLGFLACITGTLWAKRGKRGILHSRSSRSRFARHAAFATLGSWSPCCAGSIGFSQFILGMARPIRPWLFGLTFTNHDENFIVL